MLFVLNIVGLGFLIMMKQDVDISKLIAAVSLHVTLSQACFIVFLLFMILAPFGLL